jgi:predicted short-subunit dehydrogenase-like oxidoreductase (DUF2520 family)
MTGASRVSRVRRVAIIGSGKVGRALAAGLRRAGDVVTLRSGRKPLPRVIDADVVVLAVRDGRITEVASALRGRVSRRAVCVHVAGAVGPEALAPLRGACAGVAQMHPLASFASSTRAPDLRGVTALVTGDRVAAPRARAVARAVGMVPRTFAGLDLVSYHTAAALVANGSAALAAAGAELLASAGVPPGARGAMLGALMKTVAANVAALGTASALTGPVRRGDVTAVERQRALVGARAPSLLPLLDAVLRAQLPLARALGDAPTGALGALEALLAPENRPATPRASRPQKRASRR